jgi:hypothetical protein
MIEFYCWIFLGQRPFYSNETIVTHRHNDELLDGLSNHLDDMVFRVVLRLKYFFSIVQETGDFCYFIISPE